MSYHILHLLSPDLRVRIKLDQLHISNRQTGAEKTVPLADVAVIVAATRDFEISGATLRRMAELNVLMLVCNERYEPCSMSVPYYRGTSTDLLRRQAEWTDEWKREMWKQVITAKIQNQATVVKNLKRPFAVLSEIAERCEKGGPDAERAPGLNLAMVTKSRRAYFLSNETSACEARAARHYWKHLLPRLSDDERRREAGTRKGVNGMLDYGYAIARTAVLRSLSAHGFIAGLGIHHAPKAGSFALADDLMEPLRPWMDRELKNYLSNGEGDMAGWMERAASILTKEIKIGRARVRLLSAIDIYIQSFANSTLSLTPERLRIPMLE